VSRRFVGIDVGARVLHCAALDVDGSIVDHATLPPADGAGVARWCGDAAVVAIDAPETPSTAPHSDDVELAPKFRMARCGEIELGRRHGSWVSWVPPLEPPFPAWVEAGFRAYEALRDPEAPELLEVYPFAGFRALAGGGRPAKKQTERGREERAALLRSAGVAGVDLAAWSHHDLDALLAAVVARDRGRGSAERVSCGHDGSAIWLPAAPTRAARSRRPARGAS
jgi:predicted nuclease with RNAse H fold